MNTKKDKENQWGTLMTQAQNGDEQAYAQLLEEIYPAITHFLLKRLGALGQEPDWAQECVIAIHNSRHTYDPKRAFKPWMYAVVRYKAIDILRKKKRMWQREILDEEKVVTYAAEDSNKSVDGTKEMLEEALKFLPEPQRRAVYLTKIQGLNTQEASTREGIKPDAFRARISRAYKLMRRRMEKSFDQ